MQQLIKLINTASIEYQVINQSFVTTAQSNFMKRGKKIMCNQNCCAQRVLITTITVPAVAGANFVLNTLFNFSNAKNGDKFIIDLPNFIAPQIILGPVVLVGVGLPALINIEGPCSPSNLVSDQLVGIGSICVVFGGNSARARVIKAFNECGCECCLRKSAGLSTVPVLPLDEVVNKAVK